MKADRYSNRLVRAFLGCVAILAASCGQQTPHENWGTPAAKPEAQRTAGSSAGNRRDLEQDESQGGHTLRKHVGRTDDELRQRLRKERDISAASTWTDRESAETTVGTALAAERNKIEKWESRGERRPNLALHYDAGRVIGRSLQQGASQSVECTNAVIVLRAAGESFYVLTAYPEARE